MMGVAGTMPVPTSVTRVVVGVATAARASTVRWRNTSLGVNASPAARARLTSWIATMLSPPSVKKLSRTPTSGSRSTSANTAASVRSVSVAGAAAPVSPAQSGSGNAFVSSFPLGVNGSVPSTTTNTDGTRYSGSSSATTARTAAASTSTPDR